MKTKTEKRRFQLVEIAAELRDDTVPLFAVDDPDECELCGAKEFESKICEYDAVAERYQTECCKSRCDGELTFWRLNVEVGDMLPAAREECVEIACSADCGVGERYLMDVWEAETPVETESYTIPMPAITTNRICTHHTSYDPEETMQVCESCHGKIHHNPAFRNDLEPEMRRAEWEAKI